MAWVPKVLDGKQLWWELFLYSSLGTSRLWYHHARQFAVLNTCVPSTRTEVWRPAAALIWFLLLINVGVPYRGPLPSAGFHAARWQRPYPEVDRAILNELRRHHWISRNNRFPRMIYNPCNNGISTIVLLTNAYRHTEISLQTQWPPTCFGR